jgi:hypothetical protein
VLCSRARVALARRLLVGGSCACSDVAGCVAAQDGSATMTREQCQWVAAMKAMTQAKPARHAKPPKSAVRRAVYNMVHTEAWEAFIM